MPLKPFVGLIFEIYKKNSKKGLDRFQKKCYYHGTKEKISVKNTINIKLKSF